MVDGLRECVAGRREAGPRVLLLRSGRHLRVAMDALAARFPGCEIAVVGTPGSEPALAQAGLAAENCFIHQAPRLQPLAFIFSRTAVAAWRWQYDHVAILWNDPEGTGQGNVDRTALAISPGGYLAITPDGTIVERSLWPQVRTEGLRFAASIGVGAVLAILLYVPAAVAETLKRIVGRAEAIERPAKAGLHKAQKEAAGLHQKDAA